MGEDKRRLCKYPLDPLKLCMKPVKAGSDFCESHGDTWPQDEKEVA